MGDSGNRPLYYAVLVSIALISVVCAGYILAHQGSGVPRLFEDSYELRAELDAANGVIGGIGQPVNVAGVDVGSIVDAKLARTGRAIVTMEIRRGELPRVYRDASVALRPITPLSDMQIELDPGTPDSGVLATGDVIGIGRTTSPAQLADLLKALDGDTRDYLTVLITEAARGTDGRGPDMRRALAAFGPTTKQVGSISRELVEHRRSLARLVTNLALVSRAATADDELGAVVVAGNQTLEAVADQDEALRESIAQMPRTFASLEGVLDATATLGDALRPASAQLIAPVERLPSTLRELKKFTDATTPVVTRRLRPFVRRAQPLVASLAGATPALTRFTPNMASAFQATTYLLNLLAYNTPEKINGYPEEGGLFWTVWLAHLWNDWFGMSDAHGAVARALPTSSCKTNLALLNDEVAAIAQAAANLPALCPE